MSVASAPRKYEWSVEEYEKLNAAGIFTENDRVELLNGEIIVMSPIGFRHAMAVSRLSQHFAQRARNRFQINPGNPLLLDERSEPQPDLILMATEVNGQGRHPDPSQIYLLIEVSDSALQYDREVKGPAYARCGIREYWILNLDENALEIYREPSAAGYRKTRTCQANESIAPEAFPKIAIRVGDFLL